MADAGRALIRAVEQAACATPTILGQQASGWLSATFSGAHHRLVIRLPRAAAARLSRAATLGHVTLQGHVLVDLSIRRRSRGGMTQVQIGANTVEEA